MVTVPRWVAMIRSMASERPVITSWVARRARVALVTPSSELRGPPVPMPRMTAISSHTSSTAGWRGDGVIFSPPLPDRDRACTARSQGAQHPLGLLPVGGQPVHHRARGAARQPRLDPRRGHPAALEVDGEDQHVRAPRELS